MPSTISRVDSIDFASSTVITPSLPTFSIASASILPIVWSPFAEIVPTWAISALSRVDFESLPSSSTIAATALSTPRLRSIGFMPAATALVPSRKIACASTVAVVVPSPATSEVFEATSRTILAPRFSKWSSRSISLATVTPSLVTVGEPQLFSIRTLRPRGPRVTRTALASLLTPASIRSRTSSWYRICLAAIARLLLEHGEDVVLADDQVVVPFELDLGARVLAEQDPVALLHLEGRHDAILVHLPATDGNDAALHGLLLGRVGND